MELAYKPDFETVQKRMLAWWHQAVIDRICIQVMAPKGEPREIPAPQTLRERWLDTEYVLTRAEEGMRCTYFGGDAFPMLMPNLGPDAFAAYLGAELEFHESTTWAKPLIDNWDEAPPLELDFSAQWWRKMEQMCTDALKFADGKFIVSLPDGHGGADCLAALRGQEALCLDFLDRPDVVADAMAKLDQATIDYYERLFPVYHEHQPGGTGFVRAWGPGKSATSQCDFLALVSPQMSREFIMEGIRAETEYLDHAVFHLDGPDALPHLDLLLDIPGIEAIQWVPGSGNPSTIEWLPYLKRIQDAGRSLWLIASGADEAVALMKQLRPEGLMIIVGVDSIDTADRLVKQAGRLGTVRK